MGTNFYLRKLPTLEEKEELKKFIDEDKLDEAVDAISKMHCEIHICKRSYGWQVCFDHNWGKFYQPNKKSLDKFLHSPNSIIVDEYGEHYSPEQFWKNVNTHNSNSQNGWTASSYEEYELSNNPHWTTFHAVGDREECFRHFGIKCDSDDFEVDGLRFAVYSDFS